MKKHRITKIREASGTSEKEVSPEQLKQAQEWIADKLLDIVLKTPKDAPPVKESFSELLSQLDDPKRAPVVVQTFDGKRLEVRNGITNIISGGESKNASNITTKNASGDVTKFEDWELEILRKIQNGE